MEENCQRGTELLVNDTLDDEEILICACHSTEHQIVIQKDDDDKILYCSIHLYPLPWYQRLINGVKYIFGYRCKYGDFDDFLFDEKHIDKLQKMINFLNKNKNE